MSAASRGSRAAALMLRRPLQVSLPSSRARICADCLSSVSAGSARRHYAAAAAAASASSPPPSIPLADLLPQKPTEPALPHAVSPPGAYTIHSGVLLARAPLLTRVLTPFEKSFFLYQKRLNERLVLPFTRYFYDKKDTPADLDWKRKVRERNGVAARDVGAYQAYARDAAWHDEALLGEPAAEPAHIADVLVRDAERVAVDPREKSIGGDTADEKIVPVDRPLPRVSQADRDKDLKRLDRKLARSLYLVVKGKDGEWKLPSGELIGKESLHRAAERVLVQAAGVNMNTWLVGRVPIGHHVREAAAATGTPGCKTFFLKARIMAGQADVAENPFGFSDFRWLTKGEVQKLVHPAYFASVKNMMADR